MSSNERCLPIGDSTYVPEVEMLLIRPSGQRIGFVNGRDRGGSASLVRLLECHQPLKGNV